MEAIKAVLLICALLLPRTHALCAPTPLRSLAGTPAAIAELRAQATAGASPLALLPEAFPFELDDFQLDSLRALHDGQSVVVSAPTGSGKTVCGEIGCYLALCASCHCPYTCTHLCAAALADARE